MCEKVALSRCSMDINGNKLIPPDFDIELPVGESVVGVGYSVGYYLAGESAGNTWCTIAGYGYIHAFG